MLSKVKVFTKVVSPGPAVVSSADKTKANRLLSYEPKVKIETGMKLFVDWYLQKNGRLNS